MQRPEWTERLLGFLWAVFLETRRVYLPFMAGSLAYYALISLLPVFTLLLVVLSTIGGDVVATQVASLVESYFAPYLTARGQSLVANAFSDAAGGVGVSILSVVILLWSAFRLFRGTRIAFAQIFDVSTDLSPIRQLRDGIVLFVAIEFALIVAMAAGVLRPLVQQFPYVDLFGPITLVLWFTIVFVPLYYVFPGVEVSFSEVIPGAVVAAVGWTSLEALFRLYFSLAGMFQAYDLLGGFLLFVTWLYFSALVFLLGAVVNAVAAKERSRTPT